MSVRTAVIHLSAHDPILAVVIANSPLPTFTPHKKYYQELVDSIISQQLSVKAARSIENRFKEIFDGNFPTPEQIIDKDIEELRSAGLSRQKARYVQDLATKILDHTVNFDAIDELSNEAIISTLIQVKGIGIWTVHMFLIFCMGRLDILPVGDLAIRNGMMKLYNFDHVPDADEIKATAIKNRWHPYESVASWYIWQSLNNKPAL